MLKIGDKVFVKDSWFLSPDNQHDQMQQMNMYIESLDENEDYVEMYCHRTLRMKLSDLKKNIV